MLKVGLTGGIAAGKSLVARRLRERGALLIDADVLAREVVEPGTPGLQAVVAAILLKVLVPAGAAGLGGASLGHILFSAIAINVFLAVFNLIPIPPLDGGNVLAGLLPPSAARIFDGIRPFGFIILWGLLFTGALSAIILPPAFFLIRLLQP